MSPLVMYGVPGGSIRAGDQRLRRSYEEFFEMVEVIPLDDRQRPAGGRVAGSCGSTNARRYPRCTARNAEYAAFWTNDQRLGAAVDLAVIVI